MFYIVLMWCIQINDDKLSTPLTAQAQNRFKEKVSLFSLTILNNLLQIFLLLNKFNRSKTNKIRIINCTTENNKSLLCFGTIGVSVNFNNCAITNIDALSRSEWQYKLRISLKLLKCYYSDMPNIFHLAPAILLLVAGIGTWHLAFK